MGIVDVAAFIKDFCQDATVPIDLGELSKQLEPMGDGGARLRLVIDAHGGLDRLYGGFFTDWVCGGEWNRMTQFLTHLQEACKKNHIELLVCFNGALENHKLQDWCEQQLEQRQNIENVLTHLNKRGTLPPKIWWVPPVLLDQSVRYAFQFLSVKVASSVDDHHQEVIAACRENNFHAVMAEHPVFMIFNPPRFVSAKALKLTFKGVFDSVEYKIDEVAKSLEINPRNLCVFGALLGNHILPESDLHSFYSGKLELQKAEDKFDCNKVIRAVAMYMNKLGGNVDNLDYVADDVFSSSSDAGTKKVLFKQSVQYYLNGTADGFLQYKPAAASLNAPGAKSLAQTTATPEVHGKASPEVVRVAAERHSKGLMTPWIYQILTQGEIKISVSFDDAGDDLPCGRQVFRPVRQKAYGILFNTNDDNHKIAVKEWFVPKGAEGPTSEMVSAKSIDWSPPPIEAMWMGTTEEDKNIRLKAFLSCMSSDSPMLLNSSYVPQHFIVICCVLRQMIQFGEAAKKAVLLRSELDAFLAQSVSPRLHDVQGMTNLQLPTISPRGAKLAALFMRGVESAIFANDACGAPVPWEMVCPWLYFDGKLFHMKLLQVSTGSSLIELCENDVEQVVRVERLRQAILEGLQLDMQRAPLPSAPTPLRGGMGRGMRMMPAGMPGWQPLYPFRDNRGGRRGRGGRWRGSRGGRRGGSVGGGQEKGAGDEMPKAMGRGCSVEHEETAPGDATVNGTK